MLYIYDKPECSCFKDSVKYAKEGYSLDKSKPHTRLFIYE